jgi:hypothetical protein
VLTATVSAGRRAARVGTDVACGQVRSGDTRFAPLATIGTTAPAAQRPQHHDARFGRQQPQGRQCSADRHQRLRHAQLWHHRDSASVTHRIEEIAGAHPPTTSRPRRRGRQQTTHGQPLCNLTTWHTCRRWLVTPACSDRRRWEPWRAPQPADERVGRIGDRPRTRAPRPLSRLQRLLDSRTHPRPEAAVMSGLQTRRPTHLMSAVRHKLQTIRRRVPRARSACCRDHRTGLLRRITETRRSARKRWSKTPCWSTPWPRLLTGENLGRPSGSEIARAFPPCERSAIPVLRGLWSPATARSSTWPSSIRHRCRSRLSSRYWHCFSMGSFRRRRRYFLRASPGELFAGFEVACWAACGSPQLW